MYVNVCMYVWQAGSTMEFERELRELGRNRSNVHFAKDVQIVYGASTATILVR